MTVPLQFSSLFPVVRLGDIGRFMVYLPANTFAQLMANLKADRSVTAIKDVINPGKIVKERQQTH
jgi:hypothetical protein